jgi:hypothetical protein
MELKTTTNKIILDMRVECIKHLMVICIQEEKSLYSADLNGADLRDADLNGADLRGADLNEANLKYADLNGADLDFTSLPLSCKGLEIKMDKRQIIQLLFHTASNMQYYLKNNTDPVLEEIYDRIYKIQDQFHRKEEVKELDCIKI